MVAKAVARGLPVDSLRAVALEGRNSRRVSQEVAARLPDQVRFVLLRVLEKGSRIVPVLRVPQTGGGRGAGRRAALGWEEDLFDLREPGAAMNDRYLVVLHPLAEEEGLWFRLEIPRAAFIRSESSNLGWMLVFLFALLVGGGAFLAVQQEIWRRAILNILGNESGGLEKAESLRIHGKLGDTLGTYLEEVEERRGELDTFIADLQITAEHLNESLERIYSVSHEQSGGASSQAAAIQEVSTTAEEMAATARQISDNAARVTALAEETAQACDQGHASVKEAIKGMEEVRCQVEAIAKRMTVLGANSSKIGGVIAIIDEISKQTNLLALNAAIEAAGAGESGKRFGIVAVEVKRLADKTSNATKMIKDLIHAIQEDTENTVRESELGTEAAVTGAELVGVVGEALQRIAERVEFTTHSAREIRVSTGQQTHASSQMAGSLGQITDASKQIEEGTHRTVGALVDLRELSRGIHDLVSEVEVK
jgi:methyl-accepting chemotaxis protein